MTSTWDAARRHFGARLQAWRDAAGDQQATLDGSAITAVRAPAPGEPVPPIVRSVAEQVVAVWQRECRRGPRPGPTPAPASIGERIPNP